MAITLSNPSTAGARLCFVNVDSSGFYPVAGGGVWRKITAQPVRELLAGAVANPQAMTHSWLVTGSPGSGRSIAAKAFATVLVCPNGGGGECEQGQSAAGGTRPDIGWIATTASVIPVAA